MGEATPETAAGPLQGIRVLEMATMMAGPYGATLLGDLGADVIKLESPRGDDSRHLGPERKGQRAPFLSLNRNKRAMVLDLQKPAAGEVLERLVQSADVLITNIREPALSHLGLGYEKLSAQRPELIWVGVTAFGPDGPYAGRPGIDFLAQGYAGLLAQTGDPSGPPVRVTVPVVDTITSLLVASGVLAALHARTRTGKGQRVDISLIDAVVHAMCSGIGGYLLAGDVTPRTGNRSHYFAPSGIYRCQGGDRIVITCPSDKFFRNLCQALEVGWADDPRFARIEARLEHQDALDAEIERRCGRSPRAELLERLVAADVLAAPIQEIPDVVQDPQILHNEMIVSTAHPTLGSVKVTGVPIHLRGTPGSVRRGPPLLGQHTREILAELGYPPGEIISLMDAAAVAATTEESS